jgi:hypothetical protein
MPTKIVDSLLFMVCGYPESIINCPEIIQRLFIPASV